MSVVREELLAVLRKLKKSILESDGIDISEQDTRQGLINPLFRSLGWDFSDFTTIKSEFRLKKYNEPVDYAFFRRDDAQQKPLLLVEAKALGANLQDGKVIKQICSYMGTMGVQWGVLTDGNKYIMYNSNAGISFEEQKFLTCQIKSADTEDGIPSEELADELIALIGRDSLENDGIQKFYQERAIDRHIEDALESLLTEPFDTLAAAIRKEFKQERVKTDQNLRINTQQIISYLKKLKDNEGKIPFTINDDVSSSGNVLQTVIQSQQEGVEVKEVEARRTKRITIADLLAEGLIKASDRWRINYKGEITWGRITSNGEIEINGTTFTSPSKAGCAVVKFGSCDGWRYWQYKNEQGEWHPICVLREQYRDTHGLKAVS